MYYTIYKITNLINNKFYIGKHQTQNLNDDYFGSGKKLKNSIKHYGQENFYKEILETYDAEWKMNLAERILVVPDKETNYNLCSGGKGGFSYINANKSFDDRSVVGKFTYNKNLKGNTKGQFKRGSQRTMEMSKLANEIKRKKGISLKTREKLQKSALQREANKRELRIR